MKEVILHIGQHKTGSTSIQFNLQDFDDGKSRYAQLGHPNHSVPLFTFYSHQRYRYYINYNVGRTKPEVDKICEGLGS